MEIKKKQDTKTNVGVKKRITIKRETPSKGELDVVENPPVPYKSTKTYVRNKSSGVHIAFEEDIKPEKKIKTELDITENEVDTETVIKTEIEESVDKDQMQIFANTVALQLNNLPLDVAMNLQIKIQNLIVDESMGCFNSIKNVKQ